jgi:hypothetical protein
MNPQIRHAQRACEAAKARQAVVVWFDEHRHATEYAWFLWGTKDAGKYNVLHVETRKQSRAG